MKLDCPCCVEKLSNNRETLIKHARRKHGELDLDESKVPSVLETS